MHEERNWYISVVISEMWNSHRATERRKRYCGIYIYIAKTLFLGPFTWARIIAGEQNGSWCWIVDYPEPRRNGYSTNYVHLNFYYLQMIQKLIEDDQVNRSLFVQHCSTYQLLPFNGEGWYNIQYCRSWNTIFSGWFFLNFVYKMRAFWGPRRMLG